MKTTPQYPTISVVIPVYNPGIYLEKCLESLRTQTYEALDVWMIDDGSTDDSAAVCRRYAQRDDRFHYCYQQNSGVSAARNRGMAFCRGDYVHFLDSDDFLEADCYEQVVRCLREQACDIVCFEYYVDYPGGSIRHGQAEERYTLCDGHEAVDRLFSGFQFSWNKVFPLRLIQELRFREDIFRGEDTFFAAEVLARAGSVYYTDRALYHYVQSGDSATRGRFRESQLTILKLYEAYDRLFREKSFRARHFMPYMQDNLILIYFDMWADGEKHAEGKRLIKKALRRHFFQAVRDGHSMKQLSKYTLASLFPDVFCLLHKRLHHL